MDLQFPMIPLTWLRSIGGDTRSLEETLEVKLTDSLPDIGKVLCGFGQALVRGKQWSRDSAGVSGGVMAWVLYQPEDGSDVRSVECWIPFQARWDTPERDHDGVIMTQCYLQGVDARSLSARKLMVRVQVGLSTQAMVTERRELPQADSLPEDIQVLKKKLSALLPREAGEKTVTLEDTLAAPAGKVPKKLLYYTLSSQIHDCKLMADRAVFRGVALGHALCRGEDGELFPWDFQQPFSQYAELDREYADNALLQVTPVTTGLEMELLEDNRLHMKLSLAGQYLVLEKQDMELVADAYSPQRDVTLHTDTWKMPVVTDILENTLPAEADMEKPFATNTDWGFTLDAPQTAAFGPGVQTKLSGKFQVLGMDEDGVLSGEALPWEQTWELGGGEDACVTAWLATQPQPVTGGHFRAELGARAMVCKDMTVAMVTGITLGQPREEKADRPSLVLRRAGTEGLWEIAKEMGTTVQAIENANGLTQEPEPGSWMLIPVP